jgi:DNA-binding LacI/PurR family transcriptional regulator
MTGVDPAREVVFCGGLFMHAQVQRHSLITQAAAVLRQELMRSTWPGRLPGERQLAAHLGVSRPTLRAALRLLQKEGRVAIRHGRPTEIRELASETLSRPRQVNLLSPVPLREMPPLMVCWVDELRERLAAAGHLLELVVRKAVFAERGDHALRQIVEQGREAVWVLYLSTARMQRWFVGQRVPALVAGSTFPDVCLPSVDLDYRATCRHAAGVLFGKGRRNPALLLPDSQAPGDLESAQGFAEAFACRNQEPVILRHDGSPRGVCEQVRAACAAKVAVDGFVVARSAHALTVLTWLQREGLRVPEQVAVISRDDDAYLSHAVPEVARYASDPRQWAQRVSGLTLELMAGSAPIRRQRLMPRFVKGGSL